MASTASTSTNVTDEAKYLPLVRAIVKGNWKEAQEHINEFLKLDINALTTRITSRFYRALHFAIDTCDHPDVVKGILELINPEILPDVVDFFGRNPMQYAALVGNTAVAVMLAEKNPNLLFICDKDGYFPIHNALLSSHISTSQYFLKACAESIHLCKQEGYDNPFKARNGAVILRSAINEGLLDIACKLVHDNPDVAGQMYDKISTRHYGASQ